MDKKEQEFLIGLEELTRKTGLKIGGCGCCSSPFLEAAADEELADHRSGYGFGYAGEISWISPSNEYAWGKFAASIVK